MRQVAGLVHRQPEQRLQRAGATGPGSAQKKMATIGRKSDSSRTSRTMGYVRQKCAKVGHLVLSVAGRRLLRIQQPHLQSRQRVQHVLMTVMKRERQAGLGRVETRVRTGVAHVQGAERYYRKPVAAATAGRAAAGWFATHRHFGLGVSKCGRGDIRQQRHDPGRKLLQGGWGRGWRAAASCKARTKPRSAGVSRPP